MQRCSPARIDVAAIITVFSPEPQTLLMVVAAIESGNPAPSATCLAGACPAPACNTCPNNTSSIMEGSAPDLSSTAFTATIPRSTALMLERLPRNLPIGVRATAQITGSGCAIPTPRGPNPST